MSSMKGSQEIEKARLALVKSLPYYLSMVEKKQIRDFLEAVMNLRQDEVESGHDLDMALVYGAYKPWASSQDNRIAYSVLNSVFDDRQTAAVFKDDLDGFRQVHDLTGTKYDRHSEDWEIEEAYEASTRYGFAEDWDWEIKNFVTAIEDFWGEEVNTYSFLKAAEETLQVLCFPIFNVDYVKAVFGRWLDFSNHFQPIQYNPRTLKELYLENLEPSEIFY